MSAHFGTIGVRRLAVVLALALLLLPVGCDMKTDEGGAADTPAEEPEGADAAQADEEQTYTSWQVYVNDEDSYEEGGITYTIALNLTATNPTPAITGAYTGTATASTTSAGTVEGLTLDASAIADSEKLEFTLGEFTPEGLAPLTDDTPDYAGTGSIVMKAAGSGTVSGAAGTFSNTSGQNLKIEVLGSQVTLEVTISGHAYMFQGTVRGVE